MTTPNDHDRDEARPALPGWRVNAVRVGAPVEVAVAPLAAWTPACPSCGAAGERVVRFGTVERRYVDAPVRGMPVVLLATLARHRCNDCGRAFQEPVPMVADGARITRRCADYVTVQLDLVPVEVIAEAIGVEGPTLHRIAAELRPGTHAAFAWDRVDRLCLCALCLARFDRAVARRARINPFATRPGRAVDALVCPTCAATGASLWLKLQSREWSK